VSRQYAKLNAFAKQFIGGAPRTHAYIQTCDVEVGITKNKQLKSNKKGSVAMQTSKVTAD